MARASKAKRDAAARAHAGKNNAMRLLSPSDGSESDQDLQGPMPINTSDTISEVFDVELESDDPDSPIAGESTTAAPVDEWEMDSDLDSDSEIEELTGEELLRSLEDKVEQEVTHIVRVCTNSLYGQISAVQMSAKEWKKPGGPEQQRMGVNTGHAPRTLCKQRQKKAKKDKEALEISKTYALHSIAQQNTSHVVHSLQAKNFVAFFKPKATSAPMMDPNTSIPTSETPPAPSPAIPTSQTEWKPLSAADWIRLTGKPRPKQLADAGPTSLLPVQMWSTASPSSVGDVLDKDFDGYASDLAEDTEDLFSDDENVDMWYNNNLFNGAPASTHQAIDSPLADAPAALNSPAPIDSNSPAPLSQPPPAKRRRLLVPV
ncbi:unnamed protein product [Mycena citricolor]|uniref:Uncharacterized protein n=1 Tax=Mycena citricolor TaxID=2018698 RepID=A0AAD2HYC8_9AGAR|nr:unnamed protein product [Mycena citricolor]